MTEPAAKFDFLDRLGLDASWEQELRDLWHLQDHYAVSPTLLVPSSVEELFYRSNNLVGQLRNLFQTVDVRNPDEDDIEELEPEALALFKKHFLLDETIDPFYTALKQLPDKLHVRRPGENGLDCIRGRPSLLAVKEVWAKPWTFEGIMSRLEQNQSISIEARPLLIQAQASGEAIYHEAVSSLLGQKVRLRLDNEGLITQILY